MKKGYAPEVIGVIDSNNPQKALWQRMKRNLIKTFEVSVESVNYVIINYALSNMAILFNSSLLYILFFASEIWATSNYWSKVWKLTKSKWLTVALVTVCFAAHIAMIYFIGRISGTVISFRT